MTSSRGQTQQSYDEENPAPSGEDSGESSTSGPSGSSAKGKEKVGVPTAPDGSDDSSDEEDLSPEEELRLARRLRNQDSMAVEDIEAAIEKEEAALPAALAEAQRKWTERGGTWSADTGEPKPIAEHTSWSLTTGADWSSEEKKELVAARRKLQLSLVGVAACGAGAITTASMSVAADNASITLGAMTNSTTDAQAEINHNAVTSATFGILQGAYVLAGGASLAFLTAGQAVADYYRICAKHNRTMNEPYEEVMAKVNEIHARIEILDARLKAERADVGNFISDVSD